MKTFRRILRQNNFWPLFTAQTFGAFNDNFFRAAFIALVAFGAVNLTNSGKTIYASLATALLMLPFFLFSSLAGELADKIRKSLLLKITKGFELFLMFLAALLFYMGEISGLMPLLFFMGLQSTFFGPLKYGLLPEVLTEKDLLGGNGLVGASTFLAIVLGTMAGSWLAVGPGGAVYFIGLVLVLAAVIGFLAALRQPPSTVGDSTLKINWAIWQSTASIIKSVRCRPALWLAILAISWFWALGAIIITQIPVLTSEVLGGASSVSTFLLTMFALGIGVGSLLTQPLLKGEISLRLVPIAAS
ncbi:MAG: MFS transporter, partial [Candidatus Adiutrix sp.]